MKAKQYTATAQQVFRIFGPGDLYATASDIDEALRMGGKMLPIHPQQYRALRRELATSGSTLWYHGVDATYIDTVRICYLFPFHHHYVQRPVRTSIH